MASDNELSGELEAQYHEEHEWDAQRDNFARYYKDERKTLKAATQCMIDNHGFHATPRQWERKISAWNITKYTPRSERMQQIESQGRTLVEVAQGGRRPRKYSTSNQLGVDDRNIRRFARRALSRSPSNSRARSRSSSAGQTSPCLSPRPEPAVDDLVVDERGYELDVSVFAQDIDPAALPAVLTNQITDNPQALVMEMQNPLTQERHTELLFAFPAPHHSRSPTPISQMGHNMGYEQFPAYNDGMPSNADMHGNIATLNVNTGMDQAAMFMSQPTESMDLSPSHSPNPSMTWQGSDTISPDELNASYVSHAQSLHQSFEQPHMPMMQPSEYGANMTSPATPMTTVPIVLIPPDAPPTNPDHMSPAVGERVAFTPVPIQKDLDLEDPYPDFTQHVHEYALSVEQTLSSLMVSAQSPQTAARQLAYHSKPTRTGPISSR